MPETKLKSSSGARSKSVPKPSDAYERMLSSGTVWRGLPPPRSSTKKIKGKTVPVPQTAMGRVAELGERNIENSQRTHGELKGSKKNLFNALSGNIGSYYLTHFSSHAFPDGDINLLSREQLKSCGIVFDEENTTDVDLEEFATDDFVFMGLEAGEGSIPLKKKSKFGDNLFRINLTKVDSDSISSSLVQLNDLLYCDERPSKKDPNWLHPSEERAFRSLSHSPKDVIYRGHQFLNGISHQIVADLEDMPKSRANITGSIKGGYMNRDLKNSVVNSFYRPQVLFPQTVTLPKEGTERYDTSGSEPTLKK